MITLVICSVPSVSLAQIADPGDNDHFVSLFGTYTAANGLAGSVSSKGEYTFRHGPKGQRNDLPFHFDWQLDYGSLGTKRVTATDAVPGDEPDISKNSGEYTVSYKRRWLSQVRLAVDGGVEHKRLRDSDTNDPKNDWGPIAAVGLRYLGARFVCGDPNNCPEFAWTVQGTAAAADMVLEADEPTTEAFLEPLAVVWLSFLTARDAKGLFYRLRLRGEVAAMSAATAGDAHGGHWDASLIYFFTPANGVGIRRFSGYFDHNLRDKKEATTLMLVWKFK
jgi:hypothetical protein